MFDWLQAEIETYNAAMGSKGGCVILQRFEGKVELDEASDSDHQGSPKRNVLNIVKEKFQW